MKLIHLTKIATIASLLVLSNISCAADPVKPAPAGQTNPTPSTGYTAATPATSEPTTSEPNIQGSTPSATTGGGRTFEPAPSFKTTKDGSFVPVNKFGKPFEACSTNGKGSCEINNQPVIINKLRTTTITEIVHTGSPTCLLYCIQPPVQPERCFYDPSVPECAALNKRR